jgi:hypothetical protein
MKIKEKELKRKGIKNNRQSQTRQAYMSSHHIENTEMFQTPSQKAMFGHQTAPHTLSKEHEGRSHAETGNARVNNFF